MKQIDDAIDAEVKRRLAEKDAERERAISKESITTAAAEVRATRKRLARQKPAGGLLDQLLACENQLTEIANGEFLNPKPAEEPAT